MEDHNPMERVLPCNATVREKFAEETCCLICLTVVKTYNRTKHKQTAAHKYLARCLKREIYPYPCFKCEMRFSAKSDLVHHSLEHDQELVIDENNQMFSPICCYLCRLPFKSEEELSLHCSTSVEHHVRRKMILEVALRECMALEILDNNEAKVELEESTLTSSCAVSEVQDQSTSLLSPPAKSTGHMGHCSICSVAVPVSNMTQHIGGKRHRENYEALLVNDIKSTCSSASGEILGCYQESGELLCSKSAPFKTVTGAEILATEETEKFKDYNPACSASLTDASEVKIALLSSNSNRFNAVGETSGSDQSDGDREIEMASRKPTVLAPLDLNNVAEDGLEESIQSSRSAISPVQEDPKANLLLTPSNQKDRSVDHQTYCSVCLVPVSKNNMSDHSKGKKHLQKYKALLATESKSTTASGEIFNSGQENSSKVPLHSLNKSSGTFPKTLDQSDGSGKIEIALRKPTVLALTDLNNVAEDRPEEYIQRSRGAISPVQEDQKANLLLPPANQSARIVDHLTYCSVCLVPVSMKLMSIHSKGKKHLKKYKALLATDSKSTTTSGEILNSGKKNNSKVPLHSLNTYCSVCLVPVSVNNMSDHSKGKKHLQNYKALLATDSKSTTASGKILSSGQESSSDVPLHSLNKSSVIFPKTEILVSRHSVEIVDSTQICLQEELEKLSIEHDLNDYEMECGTCRTVFQTFNNDVGLSFDLHVQNDPQHALATAVPLDRNAKQMAELIKTSIASKKQSKKRPKKQPKKAVGPKIQINADGNGPRYCPSCFHDISSMSSQARMQHLEKCSSERAIRPLTTKRTRRPRRRSNATSAAAAGQGGKGKVFKPPTHGGKS